MEEEKKEQKVTSKIKEQIEKMMTTLSSREIKSTDIDLLMKLVDIHKDIENEEYWLKKEEKDMRYRAYGNEQMGNYGNYGEQMGNYGNYGEQYGRRQRDSRGRYMARGYDAKYRGEEALNEIHEHYGVYRESGTYGAKQDTMKSLDFMLQSMVDFVDMLKEEATSQEEINLIKKYTKQISEM